MSKKSSFLEKCCVPLSPISTPSFIDSGSEISIPFSFRSPKHSAENNGELILKPERKKSVEYKECKRSRNSHESLKTLSSKMFTQNCKNTIHHSLPCLPDDSSCSYRINYWLNKGSASLRSSSEIPSQKLHQKESGRLPASTKFLDCLLMCLWKCTPGCQEVSTTEF
ncbi:uncharacterized protein LOC108740729 [Agrilus planipennis]|uniref:Uncharacterized protein LOC108740729 n=1 Tax=Agrilus planipennis TaxID=224129 RepID=A0A1W4X3G4_AGRPL|nr:uncharacterized protein LOC108740729 [Agrilus planipennis]